MTSRRRFDAIALARRICAAALIACAPAAVHAVGPAPVSAEAQVQAEAAAKLAETALRRAELERQWAERAAGCKKRFALTGCVNRLERDRQQSERELAAIESAARVKLRESHARDRVKANVERLEAARMREARRAERGTQADAISAERAQRAELHARQSAQRAARDAENEARYRAKLDQHAEATRARQRKAAQAALRQKQSDAQAATAPAGDPAPGTTRAQ